MIPLSGAQLVNTDETLAISKTPGGDIAERRRIEIRLRKSVPHEAASSIVPPVTGTTSACLLTPHPVRPRPGPIPLLPLRATPGVPSH